MYLFRDPGGRTHHVGGKNDSKVLQFPVSLHDLRTEIVQTEPARLVSFDDEHPFLCFVNDAHVTGAYGCDCNDEDNNEHDS